MANETNREFRDSFGVPDIYYNFTPRVAAQTSKNIRTVEDRGREDSGNKTDFYNPLSSKCIPGNDR